MRKQFNSDKKFTNAMCKRPLKFWSALIPCYFWVNPSPEGVYFEKRACSVE